MEVELAVTITVLLHEKHSHLLSRGYRIFLPWDTADVLAVRPQPTLRDHYNASTLSMKEGRGGRGSFRNRRWDKFMSGQVFLSLHGRKILWLQEWALKENAASCLLPNSLSATITNTIFFSGAVEGSGVSETTKGPLSPAAFSWVLLMITPAVT